MRSDIEKLSRIAAKGSRLIIGLMSGTSLDGLDIALCKCSGNGVATQVEIIDFETVAYDDGFRGQVHSIFSRRDADLEKVCLLNAWIARQHAAMVLDCLSRWKIDPADIDILASHGQSIYHAPEILHGNTQLGNATLQIGDGDHLALLTGIITISDFRQKHIAAGGEGAPLAVYGDYFIFSTPAENRIMLNIGGIANFTYLPGSLDITQVFSTDTGPGNTLMDAYMRVYFQQPYDQNAATAAKGITNEQLLAALCDNEYFTKPFPKTTGPELFNLGYLEKAMARSGVAGISHENAMATLNSFTARTIAAAINKAATGKEFVIYASGGGMHNPLLMQQLRHLLPQHRFDTTAGLQVNPDAKEAVLFAVLANECVAGDTLTGNGKIPGVTMGKISLPL